MNSSIGRQTTVYLTYRHHYYSYNLRHSQITSKANLSVLKQASASFLFVGLWALAQSTYVCKRSTISLDHRRLATFPISCTQLRWSEVNKLPPCHVLITGWGGCGSGAATSTVLRILNIFDQLRFINMFKTVKIISPMTIINTITVAVIRGQRLNVFTLLRIRRRIHKYWNCLIYIKIIIKIKESRIALSPEKAKEIMQLICFKANYVSISRSSRYW